MCTDGEQRDAFLSAQDPAVDQELADLLYSVLGSRHLDPVHAPILRALLKLSENTDLLPQRLAHNSLQVAGGPPIHSTRISKIHRGKVDDRVVAVKVSNHSPELELGEYLNKAFKREAIIWSQLHHPNVLPFYGLFQAEGEHFYSLLSPWMDNGNITDFLKAEPQTDRQELIFDIARGLEYLHNLDPPVIHGDLKPVCLFIVAGAMFTHRPPKNNIFVTANKRACIGDFGLGKLPRDPKWGISRSSSLFAGNELYCAPELLEEIIEGEAESVSDATEDDQLGYKTLASDVYAFACICYEVYHGKPRFFDLHGLRRWKAIVGLIDDPTHKPGGMSDLLWHWVECFWDRNPAARPSISAFVQAMCPTPLNNPYKYDTAWDWTFLQDSPNDYDGSMKKVRPEELTDNDIVIALMGPTGTGKSTFINCALGDDVARVSGSVRSCTSKVELFACFHPDKPEQRVFFVDTPGFDHTEDVSSEKQTLAQVADWLIKTYKENIRLSGVLHFCSVTSARFSGTDRVNLRVFTELCGPEALDNVVIVSTGWEDLETDELVTLGEKREEQLRNTFLDDAGLDQVRYCRFSERTTQSAWRIIDLFQQQGNQRRPLLIQTEVVDKRLPLSQTSAFQAIRRRWNKWAKSWKGPKLLA
ncbi:TKL/TKL-ccin protein kinase [Coprinopsis cinerea okayama7|uniref:TKL/TKL-ccin protein kinase n=1 Tax=Coprinopsis cinerea (strain Okayama-7 / 130 / ATCC MYA-4618 / FGSC 9003) TaxID=240176 RepID=D6RPI7_COPC7|nr:TKL/TKL-ccin protein kinase [Coprinopsis cinerea okayama7\|eukprot:XP_002910539.1 TKL/TKL-ccin protein kinase [Coprinopsis cinerea okayama7\